MKSVIPTVKCRDNDELFRTLSEELPVGVCIMQDGKFCYVNRAFPIAIGYTVDELVGRGSMEIVAPEDRQMVKENTMKMLRGELRSPYQFRVTCKDGSIVWVMATVKPIQHHGRRATLGNYMEITASKLMEEALKEAEDEKSVLLEEAPVGIIHTDLEGKITYVNKRFESESGYAREEIIGKGGLQLDWFPAGTTKYLAERMAARLRGDPARHWETQFKCEDGHWIWIALEGKTLRRLGVPVGFQIIAGNITERRQAEEALRQSEERYRTILEEMEDAYFEVDLAGHFTFVNNSVCRNLGYSKEELIGMSYRNFTAEEDIESVFRVFNEVYQTGAPNKGFPWKVIRKDGLPGFAEASVSLLRDGNGEIMGFRGVGRDVTERRKAEEVLQAERNKLRSVIDAMRDDLTIQDLEYNIIFQNEPVRRSSGGDRTGEKCYRVYEGRETICEDCPVEKAFRDGKAHTSVRQQVLPSGDLSFWENTANPIMDAKGRVVSCLEIGRNITERKKAQEALDIQRAYFQQLFDTSPDAIIMMDANDRTIQVNRGFEELFGYSNEEATGRSLIDLIVPREDAQDASKSLDKILGGEVVRKERVRRRKDGSLVAVSVLAYPIRFGGRFIGAYGIYTDITERRRQEQALANELTRRRLLIDQSLDGIVVLDVDAKVVEANQRFAEMLGYTIEEVRELHTWDWDKNFPPEKILEMGRNVDEKGFQLETKHSRKDGSVIDVDISINGATCAGQKLVFCVCRDVTARKKMSEALQLAAQEWSRTFDSISDAVSIHDEDFRIQRANKAFADLFGKKLHEIIGSHCYELHKGSEPRAGCPHQYTLTSGKPAAAEFYESHLGRYLLESTSPILNERGESVGAVHITRDITEHKRQNERLIIADRLASLGELAAGTAHELNNPLTSIIGFSQLLMEREIPDDIREDLKLINSEAQRAASVTRNLLTFARKHAPVKEPSQINNILEDVLKLRAHEHKVNRIEVRKHLEPDLPKVMVDCYQMQQVFLNIIMNAEYSMIEAHKKGILTIATKKQNGSTVRLSIADDGPGIPQENLGRIFDPFFTTKAAGKGTGLGLSICHGIVAEHGGQIYARSQPGEGAIIFVDLPINGNNCLKVAL